MVVYLVTHVYRFLLFHTNLEFRILFAGLVSWNLILNEVEQRFICGLFRICPFVWFMIKMSINLRKIASVPHSDMTEDSIRGISLILNINGLMTHINGRHISTSPLILWACCDVTIYWILFVTEIVSSWYSVLWVFFPTTQSPFPKYKLDELTSNRNVIFKSEELLSRNVFHSNKRSLRARESFRIHHSPFLLPHGQWKLDQFNEEILYWTRFNAKALSFVYQLFILSPVE